MKKWRQKLKDWWRGLKEGPLSSQVIAGTVVAGLGALGAWLISESGRAAVIGFLKWLGGVLAIPLTIPLWICLLVLGALGVFIHRSIKRRRERKEDEARRAEEAARIQAEEMKPPPVSTGSLKITEVDSSNSFDPSMLTEEQKDMLIALFEMGDRSIGALKYHGKSETVGHAQVAIDGLLQDKLVELIPDDPGHDSYTLTKLGRAIGKDLYDTHQAKVKALFEERQDTLKSKNPGEKFKLGNNPPPPPDKKE